MTDLDKAKAAYFAAFKQHRFNRLRDSLPPEKVTQMIGDALNNSKEWLDYQNAWIVVHGVKPIFAYDWEIDVDARRTAAQDSFFKRKRSKKNKP